MLQASNLNDHQAFYVLHIEDHVFSYVSEGLYLPVYRRLVPPMATFGLIAVHNLSAPYIEEFLPLLTLTTAIKQWA